MLSFAHPWLLLGLPLTFALAYYFWRLRKRQLIKQSIQIAHFELIEQLAEEEKQKQNNYLKHCLQLVALCCLWLALAGPRISASQSVQQASVILALDVSLSMQAQDFRPSRIQTAKIALQEFLKNAPKDLEVGLIFFDRSASLMHPLSENKGELLASIKNLGEKSLGHGTAIGEAIELAIETFQGHGSQGQEHLILLSDGESNSGIDPLEASLQTESMRIFTIGIGSKAGSTVQGGLLTRLDRQTLAQLAQSTDGQYFEVWRDAKQLEQIYSALSRSYRQKQVSYSLVYPLLLLAMLSLLLLFTRQYLFE